MSNPDSTDSFSWKAVCTAKGEVMMRKVAGEVFLVPIRGHLADMKTIYSVNPTAAFIWKHMDGKRTIGQIRAMLLEHFEVDRDQAARDISGFVLELQKNDMISCTP